MPSIYRLVIFAVSLSCATCYSVTCYGRRDFIFKDADQARANCVRAFCCDKERSALPRDLATGESAANHKRRG
jgi:hypothetical protein